MPRLFTLCLIALVTACADTPETTMSPDIFARVGDVDITRKRVERAAAKLFPKKATGDLRLQALERLIDIEILLFAARQQNLEHDFQVKSKVAQKEQELILE